MDVGDPPRRQARKAGGLVGHDQLTQLRLGVGQPLVERLLPGRSDGGGVVFALADALAEVDVDLAGLDHMRPSVVPTRPSFGTDRHMHVTKTLPTREESVVMPLISVSQCLRARVGPAVRVELPKSEAGEGR